MGIKAKKAKKDDLTEKEQKFVKSFVISWNGSEAVRQAGYTSKAPSQYAGELLKKPNISKAVLAEKEKYCKKMELTAERIYHEYACIAYFDIAKLYDEDGHLKRIIDMDKDTRAAISSCEVIDISDEGKPTKTMLKKLKTIDKKGALDSASKILNLFAADNTRNVNIIWDDLVDEVQQA